VNRRAFRDTQELKQKRLKPDVVPHVFPGLPGNLTTEPVVDRELSSTASKRMEKENIRWEKENTAFLAKDEIKSFHSLK